MSELTKCNRCSLDRIKADAKRNRKEVKVDWDKQSGMLAVYIDGKVVSWMLAITKNCAC